MSYNTSCDASVLINFLKIDRIDLLDKCSHTFFITDHVQEEVTTFYSGQKAILDNAVHREILHKTNVETPEEFATFAELSKTGQLGAGECAAISIAAHRGYSLAIDDNLAIKKASSLIVPSLILRTQDLVLLFIQERLLEIEEADHLIEVWSKHHRFHLKIKSFNELIASQARTF